MDLQGSLVDTNLIIYPSNNLIKYLKSVPINDDVPENIIKFVKGKNFEVKQKVINDDSQTVSVHLNSKDIANLNKIRSIVNKVEEIENLSDECSTNSDEGKSNSDNNSDSKSEIESEKKDVCNEKPKKYEKDGEKGKNNLEDKLHLTTSDIDWLYAHLKKLKSKGDENVPYLHELLDGAQIKTPSNEVLKRNPELEARCVKLRAQQEAREYRKMTKSVDNVRMRFPEDTISYQLKQVNRQLIAIGQFIISIFAGFLFGFKGVEWMIGRLDFGFRLLLGVMCALIIALAEIYFLAKKLNEELTIPETVQLGGPTKFADEQKYGPNATNKAIEKEHQE